MEVEKRGGKPILLLLPAALLFLILYVYPLGGLLSTSVYEGGFTTRYYAEFFGEPAYLKVLGRTVQVALSVTVLTLLLGYPLAFVLATARGKVAGGLIAVILFPFWISVLVRTYAWMVLLGWRGVLNTLLVGLGLRDEPLPLLYNQFGVHVGLVYVLLPFMVLPIYSTMQAFDRRLLRAAHSLGAGPVETLTRVFVPLTLPGVIAGCLLVFMLGLGSFVTPALLGGPRDILVAMLVEREISGLLNWAMGAAISAVLLTLIVAMFLLFGRFLRRHRVFGGL
jgi:ABC-type spermidine/putrescine transport system permease subunit I